MTIDCDFFCQSLRGSRTESEIIELEKHRPAGMSRKRFCEYLSFTRSTLYYKTKEKKTENLKIMELMDKYFIEHPTAGVLQMKSMLTLQGYTINHKKVRRLLRKMGLTAIYSQKNLSLGGCSKYLYIWS